MWLTHIFLLNQTAVSGKCYQVALLFLFLLIMLSTSFDSLFVKSTPVCACSWLLFLLPCLMVSSKWYMPVQWLVFVAVLHCEQLNFHGCHTDSLWLSCHNVSALLRLEKKLMAYAAIVNRRAHRYCLFPCLSQSLPLPQLVCLPISIWTSLCAVLSVLSWSPHQID